MIGVVADLHGHLRLNILKRNLIKMNLSNNDYLLIAGDAGIVWSKKDTFKIQEFFNKQKFTTLFIDGNHENFDLLYKYPIVKWSGGNIHRISNKIFHLMRGEVFNINNNFFFVFGGAFSIKRVTGGSPIYIWEEEMPNKLEYKNAYSNLKKIDKIDYIITHTAPLELLSKLNITHIKEEYELNSFLDKICSTVSFDRWFLGHFHKDIIWREYQILYNDFVLLEDN